MARKLRAGNGSGFRKAILLNEHFVVYGVPAIAMPVFRAGEVRLEVEDGVGVEVFRVSRGGPVVVESSNSDVVRAVRAILSVVSFSELRCRFRFFYVDDLPGWSGLGSSAAFCVAVARAMAGAMEISLSDEQVNRAAYEGERIFAKNPSGIDNTVATHGKAVWYERGSPEPFRFIHPPSVFRFVIANSGKPSLTREQVDKVALFRRDAGEAFGGACEEARRIAEGGLEALEKGDPRALGRLMDRAHELLGDIGASSDDLDRMVALCRNNGALGAKLTGAGGGGCMLALVAEDRQGDRVIKALRSSRYEAFQVSLGGEGG